MGIETWLGAITLGIAVLSLLCGASWWMASLHSLVRSLDVVTNEIGREIKALRNEMNGKHDELWDTIREHDNRIYRLESKREE